MHTNTMKKKIHYPLKIEEINIILHKIHIRN